MTEKIVGYILLVFGILIIVISATSVVMVFTRKAPAVKLFQFKGLSMDLGSALTAGLPAELTGSLKPTSAPTELVPPEMVNDTANVAAHLFLMGFLASIGQKIASLGVQLVRPIEVKLKETLV